MSDLSFRVTIKDIARECQCSVNTVSLALRDDPKLPEATRERIRKKADEMGYIKNNLASTLRSGTSHLVAIIVNQVSNPHLANLVSGMERSLRASGYDTMILCTQNDKRLGEQMVHIAISHAVDGILYFPFHTDQPLIRYIEKRGVPFVLLDRHIDGVVADTARCDDESGGYQAARHLISLGHRRFLYLAGITSNSSQLDRERGFLRACDEAGIPRGAVRIIDSASIDEAVAADRFFNLLQPIDYTAVFGFCDESAYQALNAFMKNGVRVPADVSVIGFDRIRQYVRYFPPLTSISTVRSSVAETAVRLLLRRIADLDASVHMAVLPVTVYEDGTTAPPPEAKQNPPP